MLSWFDIGTTCIARWKQKATDKSCSARVVADSEIISIPKDPELIFGRGMRIRINRRSFDSLRSLRMTDLVGYWVCGIPPIAKNAMDGAPGERIVGSLGVSRLTAIRCGRSTTSDCRAAGYSLTARN